MIGKVIDNYTIIEELGRGGMGVVYKAKEDNIRFVALKLISSDRSDDLNFLGFFEREAKSMATLDHPNIVKLLRYRAGQYLVMDYVRGKTLEEVVAEGPMDPEKVKEIFSSLLEALDYAHRIGVIHRDLKPTNIMIREDGTVKVMDFGIVKLKEYATSPTVTIGPGSPKPAPQVTTLRAFSPGYSAPEQELGTLGEVDARGDIFSLGVMLYECLTGRSSPTRDRKRITMKDFDDRVPREMAKMVIKATEDDRSNRFQTAAEMLRALKDVDSGKRPAPGKWLKLSLSALLVISVIVIALFMFEKRSETSVPPVLSVVSNPAGARTFLDGRLVGQTPLDSLQIAPGEHAIGLVKEGFERLDTGLVAGEGGSIALWFTLKRAVSGTTLTVFSTPSGANAYLGDEFIGITPVTSHAAKPGTYPVRIEKAGFPVKDSTVEIRENQNVSVSVSLNTPASLASLVVGVVPNGTVSVNGESRSVAGVSGTTFRLNAGTYAVVFTHPEYGSRTASTTLRSGQSSTLVCYFETQVNIVSNTTAGSPIPSLIIVNGKSMGNEAPAVIRLGPGKYRIGVAKDGYTMVEQEKELTITPSLDGQKEVQVVFTLRKL
jgi:serine/threonine-protein kinase